MYGAISGIEAAAETAAKLEENLNVKKKLENSETPKAFFKNTDVLKIIQAEYSINHCTQAIRNLLCKGATQEKVREYSEAYVSTKGRYIPEGSQNPPPEKSDKAYGLYLFIQGPTNRSVDLAIAMIENIIATGDIRPPALMSLNTAAPPPTSISAPQPNMQALPPPHLQNMVQMQIPPPPISLIEKVPIGIDRPLPGFNLPMKLIGHNGSNLQYIRNETGAVVTLRGIGSAFIEPTTGQEAQEVLHFSIEHSKPEGLSSARILVHNLIQTVQQEYVHVQASQGGAVQQVSVDPGMMIHQPPMDHQMMHQPVLATSITLPVVQTASGYIQQPSVAAVPPPQFNHPPPPQLSLPPPGIHIPPQSGPLVPPPNHPQQMQLQQQPGDQGANMMQQHMNTGPPQQQQQQQQQQYLITQSGQPVQGIMTSQGFVVLNQQPQQVFLSQPPGQGPHVIHQGQIAFQSAAPTTVTPVSYQLQYVQNQPPNMSGASLSLQQQQLSQHPQTVVFQQPGQVQFPNGAVHQVVGVKQDENSGQVQQQMVPSGHVMQVKQMGQTVQVMQPYSPSVQYVSSPGIRPEQTGPTQKESRKRKFTEEAEPQGSPHPPPPPSQSPLQQQQQQHIIQVAQQGQQMGQIQMIHTPQMMQPPPSHQYQTQPPQPVPHPSQTGQSIRQGVGIQDVMNVTQLERDEHGTKTSGEASMQQGKVEGGEKTPPPPPGPGNGQYPGMTQTSPDQNKQTQWYVMDPNQKNRNQQSPDYGFVNYNRRDRPLRERPTFNHYSSKPQLYTNQPFMQQTLCPPPPPPPPPIQQPQQQQQHQYYYPRR